MSQSDESQTVKLFPNSTLNENMTKMKINSTNSTAIRRRKIVNECVRAQHREIQDAGLRSQTVKTVMMKNKSP